MSSSSRQVFAKYVLLECYDRVAKLEDRTLTLKNIDIKYNIDRNIVVSLEKHLDNIDTEVWRNERQNILCFYKYLYYFRNWYKNWLRY